MQRLLVLAAVLLLFAGLAAPAVEAYAGCAQVCPDDDAGGRCADGLCCSCCTSGAPAIAGPAIAARPGDVTAEHVVPPVAALPAGEGRGLLHVPKPTLS